MKILIGAAVALIAIVGAGTGFYLSSIETATVTISLPTWKLESWAELHGAGAGGQFQTQRVQVTLTETTTGTATGAVRSAATYAAGYLVFSHSCSVNNPDCTVAPAQPGYEACRINPTGGAWCYVLQATVTCFCGERVPVRARGPGPAFNAPANTVTTPGWGYFGGAIVTVTNPAPITGGSDGTSYTVVRQSDLDAAGAGIRAQMSADLASALAVKAVGMDVIPDPVPTITLTPSVAAGARTGTFQVAASGTLGATVFRHAEVQALIANAIDRWVPDGFRLNAVPVVTGYRVEDSNERGDVTVTGKATGYLVAKFSADSLRMRLRGLSVGAAGAMIETVAPGSQVEIRLAPLSTPLLPLNVSRISISVVAQPASPN